jgi:hypothetical protein
LRQCVTQQSQPNVGFRSSTQPTRVKVFGQNLRSIATDPLMKENLF